MPYPREVLNRILWTNGSLEGVVITYVHRGAPGDLAQARGDDVVRLGRSFICLAGSDVPYHRVKRIERNGEVVFSV